jgi:protein AIR1/2
MDLEKVPDNVGRRARDKAKSRLTKAAQSRVEDDPDDWFNRANKPSNKSSSSSTSKKPKIQFSDSLRGNDKVSNGQSHRNGKGDVKLSLLERIGDPNEGSEGSKRSRKRKEREPDIQFEFDYDDDHWNDNRAGPPNGKNQEPRRHSYHHRDRASDIGRDKGRYRDRDRDRDKDQDNRGGQDRRRTDNTSHRPRYKGGYSR